MSRYLPPPWSFDVVVLWASAAAIAVAVYMATGVSLGWWGLLFWAGVGGLLGWVKS